MAQMAAISRDPVEGPLSTQNPVEGPLSRPSSTSNATPTLPEYNADQSSIAAFAQECLEWYQAWCLEGMPKDLPQEIYDVDIPDLMEYYEKMDRDRLMLEYKALQYVLSNLESYEKQVWPQILNYAWAQYEREVEDDLEDDTWTQHIQKRTVLISSVKLYMGAARHAITRRADDLAAQASFMRGAAAQAPESVRRLGSKFFTAPQTPEEYSHRCEWLDDEVAKITKVAETAWVVTLGATMCWAVTVLMQNPMQ